MRCNAVISLEQLPRVDMMLLNFPYNFLVESVMSVTQGVYTRPKIDWENFFLYKHNSSGAVVARNDVRKEYTAGE